MITVAAAELPVVVLRYSVRRLKSFNGKMTVPSLDSRICAVVTEESVEAAREAMNRAANVAGIIELRLDYLRDFDFRRSDSLASLLAYRPQPVIITCRSISEGGVQEVADSDRIRLLVEGARSAADFCDIEATHYSIADALSPDKSRLIVSHHNFRETPQDLHQVYKRITAMPAAVHKVATRAKSITDTIEVFSLLNRAKQDGNTIIALAMGPAGVVTRVLGPSRGSFLTYGSLERGKESADGQLSCDELANLYRVNKITPETVVTGIVGSPVSHSASPAMHNTAFSKMGLDFVYLPFDVDDVAVFWKRMVKPQEREMEWNLRGFSVTIPHKTVMTPLLDELDATAREAGAVNTVVIKDERSSGYNTDIDGSIRPLKKASTLRGQYCAVIGAGGAARAVVHGLKSLGVSVTVFARESANSRALSHDLGMKILPIEDLIESDAPVIINTTPVGMRGHSEGESPIPAASLAGRTIAYDLVYNPISTRFLTDARNAGCKTISGIEMLVAQAARQFELWTGQNAPIDAMRKAAFSVVS